MLTNHLLALKEMGFREPHDISFVEDGNIVTMCVADHGNNRIQVFTANNDIIQYSMTIRARGGGGVAQRTSIAVGLQRRPGAVYVKMEKIVCQNTLLMEIL